MLPTLEFLDDVLDDTLVALKTAPPHELYRLEVALALQRVTDKMDAVSWFSPQPLSAQQRDELRTRRELSGERDPAPGQHECWHDDVLGRDLPDDPGRRD